MKREEEHIIELEPIFYQENADLAKHILEALPDDFNPEVLSHKEDDYAKVLEKTKTDLSSKVISHYNSFVQAMTQIHDLGVNLENSAFVCRNGRNNLQSAKEEIAKRILIILAKYRRKKIYTEILSGLSTIQQVVSLEKKLRNSLDVGDYVTTIDLSLDCYAAISNFKRFSCVKDLRNRLQESDLVLQAKMEQSLIEVCRQFNSDNYERILKAFKKLGPSLKVLDNLQNYFLESVNILTRGVITSNCPEENSSQPEQLKKMKFKDLCGILNESRFIPCFFGILEVLFDLMYGYYSMLQWHKGKENENMDEDYKKFIKEIKQGLMDYTKKLWDEIQQKIYILLSAFKAEKLQLDDYLSLSNASNKFVCVGEEFTGEDSPNLRRSINMLSKSFFDLFHKNNMDKLITMIENDQWTPCPNPFSSSTFKIFGLKEFRNFQESLHNSQLEQKKIDYLNTFKINGNPFSLSNLKKTKGTSEADDGPDEMSDFDVADAVEEVSGNLIRNNSVKKNETAFICTTTYKIVRYIGDYLNVMKLLDVISGDVFIGLTQLLEYYIYSVYSFFGDKERDKDDEHLSPKLTTSLNRLRKLFEPNENNQTVYRLPTLSFTINLNDSSTFYGFIHRAVACESILFIQTCVESIKKYFGELLPKSMENQIDEFMTQTIEPIPGLTSLIYRSFVMKSANWDPIVKMIEATKWDVKDIPEDFITSPYTTSLFKDIFEPFSKKMKEFEKKENVPKKVINAVWETEIIYAMEQVVEGYSRAKKCSGQGRTIMKLDLATIQNGLERLTGIHPIPHLRYVENYITSFYLDEINILPWCKEHTEYTLKQQLNLVTVSQAAVSMKSTAKQQLKLAIEENYKRKFQKK